MSMNCNFMCSSFNGRFRAESLLGKTSKGDQGMKIPINEQTSPMDVITIELSQRGSSKSCKAISKG